MGLTLLEVLLEEVVNRVLLFAVVLCAKIIAYRSANVYNRMEKLRQVHVFCVDLTRYTKTEVVKALKNVGRT